MKCEKCGTEVTKGSFCPNCGSKLNNNAANQSPSSNTIENTSFNDRYKSKAKLTVIIDAIVLLVLTIFAFVSSSGFFIVFGPIAMIAGIILCIVFFFRARKSLATLNDAYAQGIELGIGTNEELEKRIRSLPLKECVISGIRPGGEIVVNGKYEHTIFVKNNRVMISMPQYGFHVQGSLSSYVAQFRLPADIRKATEANHILDEIVYYIRPEALPDSSRYASCKSCEVEIINAVFLALGGIWLAYISA